MRDATQNYITGILSSNVETVGRIYATGDGVVTALQVGGLYLANYSGITSGNPEALALFIENYIKNLIPVFSYNPVLGVFIILANILIGAAIWGGKYDIATRGRY